MAVATTNLWLYLARRDQKGVRVLTVLRGRPQPASRISDLGPLNLPQSWQVEIDQIIQDNRMAWEAFVESAEDFDTLRTNLKKRGYTRLPLNGQPEFVRSDLSVPEVNVSKLPRQSSMLRRGG